MTRWNRPGLRLAKSLPGAADAQRDVPVETRAVNHQPTAGVTDDMRA